MDPLSTLLYEKDAASHVARVTFNRPDHLNAYNLPWVQDMLRVLEDARRDESVRVLVMTGAGRAWCAGAQIGAGPERLRAATRDEGPLATYTHMRETVQQVTKSLWMFDKPVVGAINGPAAAYGVTLALLCDWRIASERAFFVDSALTVGLLADEGGMWVLPRVVGYDRALRFMLGRKRLDAQAALAEGFVHEVVAPEALLPRATAIAEELAQATPAGMRLTKLGIRKQLAMGLDAALDEAGLMAQINNESHDAHEGRAAFKEKRANRYENR